MLFLGRDGGATGLWAVPVRLGAVPTVKAGVSPLGRSQLSRMHWQRRIILCQRGRTWLAGSPAGLLASLERHPVVIVASR